VRDALLAHRSAYVGDVLNRDNMFYIPPELLLQDGEAGGSRQGDWMCQQILRVIKAERIRDEALHALRQSEAEQRRLAEELSKMNGELERRVADRTAELEVANRHLETFSYSVSHDLRAPLRAITGFSRILADEFAERLDEEGRGCLNRVRASARHMDELIDGMLALGRVVKADLSREPIDLTAMAEEIVRELRSSEPQRVVDIAIDRGLCAMGDPSLVRAVLTNLLGNAWKFTSKRSSARIELMKTGEEGLHSVFVVRDNGAGFDAAYASKLFGVYQRLHRQEEFPGNGVGLATVERIISRHGGRIWAEGHLNLGAKFFFTLPRSG
jgi:light-regulated signal transduction histidine kinase (bacteriophytochrome)